MEGFTGEAGMRSVADWEPEETAAVVAAEQETVPGEELTRFAGQTMTTEAAFRMAADASGEGMGI